MTPQPGKQTITTYILPNILRGIGNQTMKYGQLMHYNKARIFFQKSNRI